MFLSVMRSICCRNNLKHPEENFRISK